MLPLRKFTGLLIAVGCVAAAHAFVQTGNAMELPAPPVTVSVPALPAPPPVPPVPPVPPPTLPVPVPTPPVPTPPVPTVPVPTPPVPTPPVKVPPVTPPPAPAPPVSAPVVRPAAPPASGPRSAAAAPEPQFSAAPQQPNATHAGGSGTTGTRSGSPAATTGSQRLAAKPHRGKNRVSVRLVFTLSGAKRVFVVVRGPAPACDVAGVIPYRGRAGRNTVEFKGRIRGRALDRGIYLLTVSPTRRPAADAPTAYVRVVSERRSVPLPDSARKPGCDEDRPIAGAKTGATATWILLGEPPAAAGRPVVQPAAPLRPPLQSSVGGEKGDGDGSVLPDFIPSPSEIGSAAADAGSGGGSTFAVLGLLGALLVGMLILVARFRRGDWNP